uniref:Preprotein-translocase subunit g n=1 Tax=Melanothamnus harveyi TaxID=397005 RepID=A0A1Z1MHK8_MELHR|nr:preprotein-translocase subunit g [Melanothamnus harveyi]ARW65446.1 preprotein-translocase subunit g [Melanothamnus harveyi]
MIIKFMWYCFSFLSVFLILISNPKSSTFSLSSSQNNIINIGSGQVLIQRLISFTVLMFFILTCISLLIS